MKIRILFNLNNLHLDGIDELVTSVFTISDNFKIRESFHTPDFLYEAGRSHTMHDKKKAFAFCEVDMKIEKGQNPIAELDKIIFERSQYVDGFVSLFWFIKDCCVYLDYAIGYIEGVGGSVRIMHQNSSAWGQHGKMEFTSFNFDEIRKVGVISDKYNLVNKQKIQELKENPNPEESNKIGHADDFNYNDYNPLQRALTFLAGARKIKYLPHRIAMFMPIFECLLTSDSGEVTQKVSERAAFYLSDSKTERWDIYKTIRDCYKYRSNFLHGNAYSSAQLNPDNHIPHILKIESLARNLMLKIILHDSANMLNSDANARVDYLNYIIFV